MGVLNVYSQEVIPRVNTTAILEFNVTGDLGDEWRQGFINVSTNANRVKVIELI